MNHTNTHLSPRRWRTAAATATLLAGVGAAVLTYALHTATTPPPLPTAAQAGTLALATPAGAPAVAQPLAMAASKPVSLRIPAINVDAAVDTLGLNQDGTVQVPDHPMDAGWYDDSATPGQLGAAVLLGHVDFKATGPAVFYRLGALKIGNTAIITRQDGTSATFTVTAVREFPKSQFPTGEVYDADANAAQLRLITCGSWNSERHAYTGNTVAFATLTSVSHQPVPSATHTSKSLH